MSRFQKAAVPDADAVLELMRTYYAEEAYPFDAAASGAAVLELIRNEAAGRLWVARSGEEVIAYLAVTLGFSLEYGGRDAFIDELYVAATHRGRGLGREAMRIAETYCRNENVRALHLEVERHRTTAISLYRKLGFVEHDRHLMTLLLESDTLPGSHPDGTE